MTEKVILAFVILLVATLIICLVIGEITAGAMPEQERITTEPEQITAEPEQTVMTVYDVPMPEEYQQLVREWCEHLDLDERMIYGVIFAESGFDPDAVNERTGCFGFMQLNPACYDRERFSEPKWNLQAGMLELARLMCLYRDPEIALLCYNNGEQGAHRLIAKGVTSTEYTRKVLYYAETLKTKGRLYEYG